jgi:hypothetical protein
MEIDPFKSEESLPVQVTMRTSCEQNEEAQRDFSEDTKRRNEQPGGNRKTWQDPPALRAPARKQM